MGKQKSKTIGSRLASIISRWESGNQVQSRRKDSDDDWEDVEFPSWNIGGRR